MSAFAGSGHWSAKAYMRSSGRLLVSADKSASQSKPAAALPTNSSASRQYTRSISIDL
jgi:hypothetical protein